MSPEAHIKFTFKQAYDDHADALFRYAFYKLSDREKAKDVVQDSFVKLWEYMSAKKVLSGDEELSVEDESGAPAVSNIKALLYRIATNTIIDNYRKKKELSLEVLLEEGFDPHDSNVLQDSIMDESDVEMVIKAIHSLEDTDRALMLMRYIDGLSIKEISVVTGQRENTISVKIHRALKELKELLQVDILNHE